MKSRIHNTGQRGKKFRSGLCRIRGYVVWDYVVFGIPLFRIVSFVLMSLGFMSFGIMSFGMLSVYPIFHTVTLLYLSKKSLEALK